MHIIILSCKTAVRLIEKKLHTRLSFREKVQLKWHKSVCDVCTRYEKQAIFLDKVLKHSHSETDTQQAFPEEKLKALEEKILLSLKK